VERSPPEGGMLGGSDVPKRTATTFAVGGAIWLALTATATAFLPEDPRFTLWVSAMAGVVFVVVAPLVLYAQLKRYVASAEAAHSQLQVSEQMLLKMPGAMVLANFGGVILRWMGTAEQVLGYRREEAVGRSLSLIFQPGAGDAIAKEIAHAVKKSGYYSGELTCLHKDGSRVPVDAMATAITDRVGEPAALVLVLRDIRERKMAEEELRKLTAAVEQSASIVMITDVDGNIEYVNPKFSEVTGYSPGEAIGKNPRLLKSGETSKETYEELWLTILSGKVWRGELLNRKKDGSYYWARTTISPIRSAEGKIGRFLAVQEDVTRQKMDEAALSRRDAILEAVGYATEVLPTTKTWDDAVNQLLERLGRATGVSRAYIFENHYREDGELLTSKKYEWVAPGASPQMDNPSVSNIPVHGMAFGRWASLLSHGRHVSGLVRDMSQAEQKLLEGQGIRSILLVPILVGQEWWGFIGFDECASEREWSHAEQDSLRAAAGALGAAIQRRRHERERELYEERLSVLNLFGAQLNRASDFSQVYELTVEAVWKTLGFEHSAFLVLDRSRLKKVAVRGDPGLGIQSFMLDGKGVVVKALKEGRLILVPDVSQDPDYIEGVPGMMSELAVPLEVEGRMVGVLDVQSRRVNAFDERDVKLLQILASHAATALGNIEKRREIEQRSNQMASLMKSSAELMRSTDVRDRLREIAEAIRSLGWRRVVISIRDENMEIPSYDDLVTSGLTEEERRFLWENRPPGSEIASRYGPEFQRFRIGEFYYLPWSDPWVRKRFEASTVPSKVPPEEMVDWNPDDLLYAPLKLADGRVVGQLSIDDPLDGRRPTKDSLAPLELFVHQAAVAIENAQLIEKLNQATEQIRGHADELERKVQQRTKELVEAQQRLLKAERLAAIGEVATMIGHDLRNPLTAINTNLFYLENVLPKKQRTKVGDTIRSMEAAVDHANRIVADLLEFSRPTELKKAPVQLKQLVEESMKDVPIPPNVRLVTRLNDGQIRVDASKIKRVLQNLISNAIDAMPGGGTLKVTCGLEGGDAVFTVEDTGQGIRPEDVKKLFTPFFTTKAKGLGLGLAICRRLAEAHGGKCELESEAGSGTKATVRIPSR